MSVLVYTENWQGNFKKLSFELVSYAAALARQLNSGVVALSIGEVSDEELGKLARFGVSRIISVKHEALTHFDPQTYARVVGKIMEKENAHTLVMAHNNAGKALAPRLAVRLKASLASGVEVLPESTDPFVIRRRVYSGNAYARTVLNAPVRILSLAQNAFETIEQAQNPEIELFKFEPEATVKTRVLDTQRQGGKLLLTDAEIVVSGGRGMKSPENWAPLEELAQLLGGATACSRPVSDEGWRPHEEHTGQTGKVIAPNLYFAVGISGATQHLAGIRSSKYIVAINTDKDAPIFEAAQYGIVGDASRVLPKLVEAVKALRA